MAKRESEMGRELVSLANELIRAERECRYWRDAFEQEHRLHTATVADLKLARMAEGDAFLRGVYLTSGSALVVMGLVAWLIA